MGWCENSTNRANRYGHVAVVHGHVWRTLCSVCATGARVFFPLHATCNELVQKLSFTGMQES